MNTLKIPMGLAVGLVLALLKVHKGENPTFLGKLDFLHFRIFSNKLSAICIIKHRTVRPLLLTYLGNIF